MKRFLILAAPAIVAFVFLILLVVQAHAQTLYAAPYVPTDVQPDGIWRLK